MQSKLEEVLATISASVFLDELCFDRNQFKPFKGNWAELADIVLWFDSHSLLIQIKERNRNSPHDEKSLARWFRDCVVADGTRQLISTHGFLRDHRDKSLRNRRGDEFLIGRLADATPVNILLYGSLLASSLPIEVEKIVPDEEIGTIHVFEAGDFSAVLRRVVTPGELLSFLDFREMHLRAVPEHKTNSEKWLFGRYVSSPRVVSEFHDLGEHDFEKAVDELVDDTASLDLRPYLAKIPEMETARVGGRRDYYHILIELGLLKRGEMREYKKRFLLCFDKLESKQDTMPYRIGNERRDCVFVLSMCTVSEVELRRNYLVLLTALAKYDCQKLRCLGVMLYQDEKANIRVEWCWLEHPWKKNGELDRKLSEHYPFRPLKKGTIYDYYTKS